MSLVITEGRRDVLTPMPYSFDLEEQNNYLEELFSSLDSPIDNSYSYIKGYNSGCFVTTNSAKSILKKRMSSSLEVNSSGSSPYSTSPLSSPKKRKSKSLDMVTEEQIFQSQPSNIPPLNAWGHLDCEQNASVAVDRIPSAFEATSNESWQYSSTTRPASRQAHHPRPRFHSFNSNQGHLHGFHEQLQAPATFNFNNFTNINMGSTVPTDVTNHSQNKTGPSYGTKSISTGQFVAKTSPENGNGDANNTGFETRDSRESDAEFLMTLGVANADGHGTSHVQEFLNTKQSISHMRHDVKSGQPFTTLAHDVAQSNGTSSGQLVESNYKIEHGSDQTSGLVVQPPPQGDVPLSVNESSGRSTHIMQSRGRGQSTGGRARGRSVLLKQRRVKWSDLDIFTLWKSIQENGNEWTEVDSCLPSRTYHQLKDKGRRMLQENNWQTGRTKHDTEIAGMRAKEIAARMLQEMLQVNPNLQQQYLESRK